MARVIAAGTCPGCVPRNTRPEPGTGLQTKKKANAVQGTVLTCSVVPPRGTTEHVRPSYSNDSTLNASQEQLTLALGGVHATLTARAMNPEAASAFARIRWRSSDKSRIDPTSAAGVPAPAAPVGNPATFGPPSTSAASTAAAAWSSRAMLVPPEESSAARRMGQGLGAVSRQCCQVCAQSEPRGTINIQSDFNQFKTNEGSIQMESHWLDEQAREHGMTRSKATVREKLQ